VAFEPQSTVGDVCNKMFIELSDCSYQYLHHTALGAPKLYWPELTTHDEIVLETKEENANLTAQAMSKAAEIPLNIRPNVEPLIIPIEIAIGRNWRDTEEWISKK